MAKTENSPFRILIADDDKNAVQLTKDSLLENQLSVQLNVVEDGRQLIDHLKANAKDLPQLIILEQNISNKRGFEALSEMKQDEDLRKIPVVIFSNSTRPDDIEKAYDLGASCYISKPTAKEDWSEKVAKLGKFWIECVKVCRV